MKTFKMDNITQSPELKTSSGYRSTNTTPLREYKENSNTKFSNFATSDSPIRKNAISKDSINNWENGLGKELNKILEETLNSSNKENKGSPLVDHRIRDMKYSLNQYDESNVKQALTNNVIDLQELSLPNTQIANFTSECYSVENFLNLLEKNHLLISKMNEVLKSINIYNVKKGLIIDNILNILEHSNPEDYKVTSDDFNPDVGNELQLLFATNRRNKQQRLNEMNEINENLSLCESHQNYSEVSDDY